MESRYRARQRRQRRDETRLAVEAEILRGMTYREACRAQGLHWRTRQAYESDDPDWMAWRRLEDAS